MKMFIIQFGSKIIILSNVETIGLLTIVQSRDENGVK